MSKIKNAQLHWRGTFDPSNVKIANPARRKTRATATAVPSSPIARESRKMSGLFQIMYVEIAKPIIRRLGSMASAYLLASGVAVEATSQIVAGLSALALVAVDLIQSSADRRKIKGDKK